MDAGDVDPAAEADAAAQAAADLDRQDLLLLRNLPPLLAELRAIEDPGERISYEVQRTRIAICERIRRLAGRDLPAALR